MTDTINTRELIMNILLEMDREKTPCHLAVKDALDKYQFLPRQDRAFIKRVCEGTVEYGIQNDYIIFSRKKRPDPEIFKFFFKFSDLTLDLFDHLPVFFLFRKFNQCIDIFI